jgi:hypothetical protein
LVTAGDVAKESAVDWRRVFEGFCRSYSLAIDVVASVDAGAGNFNAGQDLAPLSVHVSNNIRSVTNDLLYGIVGTR